MELRLLEERLWILRIVETDRPPLRPSIMCRS